MAKPTTVISPHSDELYKDVVRLHGFDPLCGPWANGVLLKRHGLLLPATPSCSKALI